MASGIILLIAELEPEVQAAITALIHAIHKHHAQGEPNLPAPSIPAPHYPEGEKYTGPPGNLLKLKKDLTQTDQPEGEPYT